MISFSVHFDVKFSRIIKDRKIENILFLIILRDGTDTWGIEFFVKESFPIWYEFWLGKDLSAIVRLILGGELTEYTDMMGKARQTATNRMVAQAGQMGADAIINIRYMTTSVVGSAAELLAYGTAVKLS